MTTFTRNELNKQSKSIQASNAILMSATATSDENMFQTILLVKDFVLIKSRVKDCVIISTKTSGAGRIDMLLKRAEGCTKAEMAECRGAVDAHIAALRRKGHNIVCEKGRYFYKAA